MKKRISYDVVASPVGRILVARSERGVCSVRWAASSGALVKRLRRDHPEADLRRDPSAVRRAARAVVGSLYGRNMASLPLDLGGTEFQRAVWSALRRIPFGRTRTYGEIARAVGRPRAARAVGAACGANPVPLLVPCHRVVAGGGKIGGFSMSVRTKRALLESERRS